MKFFSLILLTTISLSAFASDSTVTIENAKTSKAIKISGAVAKEIYETLTKLSAHGDYKYGNGVTCTSSSKEKANSYQCALLLDGTGIR